MKKVFLLSYLLMSLIPVSFAAEGVLTQPAVISNSASENQGNLSFTFLGNGKIVSYPGTVFTTGDEGPNFELPYLVSYPKQISYPMWAIHQGWEGKLVLAVEILQNGSVGRTAVMESTGRKILDEAATHSIQTWKFHPAMKNGQPALTCIQIPIVFQLAEK